MSLFSLQEHTPVRWIYYSLQAILALLVLAVIVVLFVPLFGGFLFAFLLNPLVTRLERRGWGRAKASVVVLLVGMTLSIAVGSYAANVMIGQGQEIAANQQDYVQRFTTLLDSFRSGLEGIVSPQKAMEIEAQVLAAAAEQVELLQASVPGWLANLPTVFTYAVFIPIFTFFFLLQGREIKKFLISLVPNRYFEMVLMMVHKITQQLGGYLRGQFWDCVFIGLLASVGLSIIGVQGAIPIGIFAGIANAVPYMGPVLGCIPAMLSLLMDPMATNPWWSAIIVFIVVNVMDNILVYPLTVGKSLQLNPMMVMLGILFGGSVGGIPGMIVAVPLLSMIRQIFQVLHFTLKSYKII